MATPDPQTYAEVLVPDAIEPLYGWKALEITADGRLSSPQQKQIIWPVKKRLEAICVNNSRPTQYQWTAVHGEPKPAPTEVASSFQGGVVYSTSSAVTVASGTSGSMMVAPIEQPKTLLPEGMSWSWEPVPHEIVAQSCRCGIYVVNDPRQCQSYIGQNCVLAEICLWGRVVPASDGARGQYAYPRQLFAPDTLTDVATMVAELYGVPIGYRNHQTGATITYREAMENLARLKAGLNTPFVQAKHPTTIPKRKQLPPPPPKPGAQPAQQALGPSTQIIVSPPAPLPNDQLSARQARKQARVGLVLCSLAMLALWTLAFAITPVFLVGVLPIFFTVGILLEISAAANQALDE